MIAILSSAVGQPGVPARSVRSQKHLISPLEEKHYDKTDVRVLSVVYTPNLKQLRLNLANFRDTSCPDNIQMFESPYDRLQLEVSNVACGH